MRILQISDSFSPSAGGTVESILQSSRLLRKMGHQVELLSFDEPTRDYIIQCDFPVRTFPATLQMYRWNGSFVSWLKENSHSYDAVLAHGLWLFSTFGTHLALKNSSTPYFIFSHGMLDPWFNRRYPKKYIKKLIYWFLAERWSLAKARAVFFTCNEELALAKTAFPFSNFKGQVVPFGTTKPQGERQHCREVFFKTYPHLEKTKNFLFVGRIHPKKGCDLLIHAFARVIQEGHDVQLIMMGPDQVGWQAELEKLAEGLGVAKRITWTGLLGGDLKVGAYYSADVFVLPSHQENFGIVVAEAMACDLPVLISRQVNIWDVAVEGGAGIAESDDEAGTYRLLSQWLKLEELEKTKMRKMASLCFLKNFNIQTTMSQFAEMLERLSKG